jgi:hypothetical protein
MKCLYLTRDIRVIVDLFQKRFKIHIALFIASLLSGCFISRIDFFTIDPLKGPFQKIKISKRKDKREHRKKQRVFISHISSSLQ